MKEEIKEILEIKRQLEEAKIDTSKLLFCPQIPILGIEKNYVIEEVCGIKIRIKRTNALITLLENQLGEKDLEIGTNYLKKQKQQESINRAFGL